MSQAYDQTFMTSQYIEAIEHGLKNNMTATEIADLLIAYDETNFYSRVQEAIETCVANSIEPPTDHFDTLVEVRSNIVELGDDSVEPVKAKDE